MPATTDFKNNKFKKIINQSQRFIKITNKFVNFSLKFRKLPCFILLLQLLTSPDRTQQQTQINSFLSRRQCALPSFNLQIVEVNELLHLQTGRIRHILLNCHCLYVHIRHHYHILISCLPKCFLFLLDFLLDIQIGILLGKTPPLRHS